MKLLLIGLLSIASDIWVPKYALFDCNDGCKRVKLFDTKEECMKYKGLNYGSEQAKMGCFKIYVENK
jgi:hypothetical protein